MGETATGGPRFVTERTMLVPALAALLGRHNWWPGDVRLPAPGLALAAVGTALRQPTATVHR